MTWDDECHLWRVNLESSEEVTARFVVSCAGGLERPKLPAIPGVEDFAGKMVHSARWDHSLDLRGKRVGVIGTGASALQLIPEVAALAGELTVFQRTPIWVLPKRDPETGGPLTKLLFGQPVLRWPLRATTGALLQLFLGMMMLPERLAKPLCEAIEARLKRWMATQVDDPQTLEKLTPRYRFGCKRPSMSNTYLKTFNLPHVTLETDTISHIEGATVHTATGGAHELDVLVCATGFSVQEPDQWPPFPVYGTGGVDLRQFWIENKCQAYEGISVPGFPNAFLVAGPYGFPVGSFFWVPELVSVHLRRALLEARRRGATRIEVRQEPHDRYFEESRRRTHRMFLYRDACAGSNTYYVNSQGEVAGVRPQTYLRTWWRVRNYSLDDYRFDTAVAERAGDSTDESIPVSVNVHRS